MTTSPGDRATGPGAPCHWCADPIPQGKRQDAKTCSKRCRQASWRFGHDGPDYAAEIGRPRRLAYADPPYPGMSWRHYRDHPDYAGEVDHQALIARLVADFPDGWALSTNSRSLRMVLALVPADVEIRIGAWTKPMPPRRRALRAVRAWEPVIFAGGRPRPADAPQLLDWVHAAPPRTLPGQVTGTKPSTFAVWLFRSLGAMPGDELVDLFPGSGAIGRAWDRFSDVRLDVLGDRRDGSMTGA
jgi:hypothetical protein